MTLNDNTSPLNAIDQELVIRKRVRQEAEFWRHALVYAVINGLVLLVAMVAALVTGKQGYWWMSAPMAFGWGIGLFVHGVVTFFSSLFGRFALFNRDWEERKVQELLKGKR